MADSEASLAALSETLFAIPSVGSDRDVFREIFMMLNDPTTPIVLGDIIESELFSLRNIHMADHILEDMIKRSGRLYPKLFRQIGSAPTISVVRDEDVF